MRLIVENERFALPQEYNSVFYWLSTGCSCFEEDTKWYAVGFADWYAVSSADNYRRTIAEGTISLNV